MAYSELIKDFKRIQAYLRSFYVYGFRLYSQNFLTGNERRHGSLHQHDECHL